MNQDLSAVPLSDDQSRAGRLRRAAMARQMAEEAASPEMAEGFIRLALEWERLAAMVPDPAPLEPIDQLMEDIHREFLKDTVSGQSS